MALLVVAVYFATRPESGSGPVQVTSPALPGAPPREEPSDDPSPAGPADPGPRGGSSRKLLEEIGGKLPHLVDQDGALYLAEGSARFPVVSVRMGNPVIATEMGRLEVDAGLLSADRPGVGSSLAALALRAKEAGFGAKSGGGDSGFVYEWDFLLGFHLRAEDRVVLAEGVATREALPGGGVTADVAIVEKAVERFEAAVGPVLPPLARTVLFDLVGLLPERDGDSEIDEFPPSFARRLVRHGWLDRVLPEAAREHARALEAGLDEATRFRPIETFKGEGLLLTKFEDAFGKGGWLLQAPTRTAYSLTPPRPHYHPRAWEGLRDARLVVELPGGVDPNRREDFWKETVALRLFHRGTLLASWDRKGGFAADETAWRRIVPGGSSGEGLKDFLPPHLLLVDLAGDVRALFTPHGRLAPPEDATPAESDRFLAEAVKALPDPPHLDLFGEYFFQYVYDSPDTASPSLVGNKKQRGDIHQTARETLGSVFGGMCRGDCDDLAEMYVEIATRQGKLAHELHLPRHAVAAWAEKRADGWHSFVLQTGPPLEFVAGTLPESLGLLHERFDPSASFDPSRLVVLIRFPGENTRQHFGLGYRIFEDPDYARTMIDVQRDWYFHTYLAGISKMKAVVEKGDEDPSNYKELSGLAEYSGQYDLAIEYARSASEKTTDPTGRIQRVMEEVELHFKNQDPKAGRELAQSLFDRTLPGYLKSLHPLMAIRTASEFTYVLVKGKTNDLALQLFQTFVLPPMEVLVQKFVEMVRAPGFGREDWQNDPALSGLLDLYAIVGVELLAGPRSEGPASANTLPLATSLATYFDSLAMYGADELAEVDSVYAAIGRFQEASLGKGEFEKRLEEIALPPSGSYDHWRRSEGAGQLARDLPWIKASVEYWAAKLQSEYEEKDAKPSRERIERLRRGLEEAVAAAARLGTSSSRGEEVAGLGRLVAALALEDEAALRGVFEWVREKNDRDLRFQSASTLGEIARALPIPWFEKALGIWREIVDSKPNYFAIAWYAAREGAPEHALLAAEAAAKRFPEEATFAAERDFMRRLLSKE